MLAVLYLLFVALIFPFLAFASFFLWGLSVTLIFILAVNLVVMTLAAFSLTSLWPFRQTAA